MPVKAKLRPFPGDHPALKELSDGIAKAMEEKDDHDFLRICLMRGREMHNEIATMHRLLGQSRPRLVDRPKIKRFNDSGLVVQDLMSIAYWYDESVVTLREYIRNKHR